MASFLAATALLATLAVGAYVHPRMRRIASLEPVSDAAAADGPAPTVALVVAARDEADAVERAVRSLLAQADTFPPGALAVVAVDDRSSDGTAAILDRLAAENDALRAVHVEALPDGWLGKNHALHLGAEAAGDVDFLLFTDADVEFEPGAVRAVAAHAWTNDLDHLAGGPRVVARSFALQGMIATFGVLFALFTRPWSHGDPRRDTACGVGALNLVRRTAYERAGGHAAIRLFVDDDLRLGRAVKRGGGRCAFVFAQALARVPWYASLGAMLRGLVKNVFAGIDYRVGVALAATLVLGATCIAPAALAAAPSAATGLDQGTRILFGATALLQTVGSASSARRAGLSPLAGLFFPVGVTLFLFVLWRSTLTALVTRRVTWRDTAYDLGDLVKFNRARARR